MKKTLQQKAAERKFHRPNKLLYTLLYHIAIQKILAPKYNPHYQIVDNINDCKGPCFLVYNHQSRIDYVWLVGATYPRRLNFLVGYNEFFRSHLAFILKLMNVIPKKNFTLDVPAMQGINSIIKQGGTVCFSPEGMSSISGHNQPVVSGTGTFLKHYGIPVYVVNMAGAYLTNTKFCLDERKGRIDAKISLLFTPEYLKGHDAETIEAELNKAIYHDDFEWNKKEQIAYSNLSGKAATNLHYMLYKCPHCGSEFRMKEDGDRLYCPDCGFSVTIDDKYNLHPDEGFSCPETITKWFDLERRDVYRAIKANPEMVFTAKCKLGKLPPYHTVKNMATSEPCGEGTVTLDKEGFTFEGQVDGAMTSMHLTYNEIPTFGMPVDTSYLAFYYQGNYYDLFPEGGVSIKMLHILEEFQRFTVSKWKALPQESWIYEDDGQ